jgi:hypothetical protein
MVNSKPVSYWTKDGTLSSITKDIQDRGRKEIKGGKEEK